MQENSQPSPQTKLSKIALQVTSPSAALWHQRLGHPSKEPCQLLSKIDSSSSFNSQHVCDVCPLAKQTRLPFSNSAIKTSHPSDLIHCDIWGPPRAPTHSGARYFLTIVDDYSCFTWIHFMRFKSEIQGILKSFFTHVQTQFNCRIKSAHSDYGAEFTSMKSTFNDLGILFQHSCPSAPQQNGVVERKHRHLLNVSRALQFQANLPIRFWGERSHRCLSYQSPSHAHTSQTITF